MFYLYPWIDLHEVEFFTVHIHQEFNGSGIFISNRFSNCQTCIAQFFPLCIRKKRGRCPFNNLLISSLNRTVPFEQMNDIALGIAQNLNLKVSGSSNKFFNINFITSKSSAGFLAGSINLLQKLTGAFHGSHSSAATAPAGL